MAPKSSFPRLVIIVLILALGFYPSRALAGSHASVPDFVVTNLNDAGVGSFRQALLNANAVAGENVISPCLKRSTWFPPSR